jgi:ribosomal protein L11 methyltransferase
MDDNISKFTKISVGTENNKNDLFDQLSLFDEIYGLEEEPDFTHYLFKGVEPGNTQRFIGFLNRNHIPFKLTTIEPTNWNKVWEDSFRPVKIGTIWHIRAEFHSPDPDFKHEIIISPKMAFGTGHHETTFMMLNFMADMDLKGKKVADLGCGSGILAIAAEKLGADLVVGIDYDPLSVENTIENAKINNSTKIVVSQADVDSFNDGGFDLILANINKKVLLESLPKIQSLINLGGKLVVSGILKSDVEEIKEKVTAFRNYKILEKSEWICLYFFQ